MDGGAYKLPMRLTKTFFFLRGVAWTLDLVQPWAMEAGYWPWWTPTNISPILKNVLIGYCIFAFLFLIFILKSKLGRALFSPFNTYNGWIVPNEFDMLDNCLKKSKAGDATSVVNEFDRYCWEEQPVAMAVGDVKGAIVTAEILKKKPKVMVELGEEARAPSCASDVSELESPACERHEEAGQHGSTLSHSHVLTCGLQAPGLVIRLFASPVISAKGGFCTAWTLSRWRMRSRCLCLLTPDSPTVSFRCTTTRRIS